MSCNPLYLHHIKSLKGTDSPLSAVAMRIKKVESLRGSLHPAKEAELEQTKRVGPS